MGSSNIPIVMSVIDPADSWTDNTSKCWPLEEHHYAEVFAVCASFETDDPPLWSALLSPSARGAALRENRGHCLNCQEDTHYFRNCRHPFINAIGCLNPELGQLDNDDAYRRWQARMFTREGTTRTKGRQTAAAVTPVTHTRRATMVVSHPRRPLPLPACA